LWLADYEDISLKQKSNTCWLEEMYEVMEREKGTHHVMSYPLPVCWRGAKGAQEEKTGKYDAE
jgi:hypothetical protein